MDGPDWGRTTLDFLQEKAALNCKGREEAALSAQKHAVGMAFIAFKGSKRDNGDELRLHQLRIEVEVWSHLNLL